ncbi:MAG: site-specific DNA-methyltransferase [Phycisphaerales bacterium]|nr:site-specific DNA-methyltransferase [Phycisphaerales bacterium]
MPATKPAPKSAKKPKPAPKAIQLKEGKGRLYIGDCREVLPTIPECQNKQVDLIFADPPFNWKRAYDKWDDNLPVQEYLDFTTEWLDLCVDALAPHGTMWVNIPDDWAAEIVVHLKKRRMFMVNWCVWHYRFGQNTNGRFINSKVHALYFCKDPASRTWNPTEVMEVSDRRSIYFDKRTEEKRDGAPAGMRLPMDVWYGQYWGRIQGNNKERRHNHDNQLPEVYLERVVRACTNPGDLVLDPFNGSGTTGTVALDYDRRFIGVEYSKDLAKSAAERMEAGMIRKGALEGASTAIFAPRAKPRTA